MWPPLRLKPLRQLLNSRGQPLHLLEVQGGELLEETLPLWGQPQADDPAVPRVFLPLDQPRPLRPVDQPHGAVMAQQQIPGDVADGGTLPAIMPPDGQQELVLRRCQPRPLSLLFAPVQKAPQADPELEEAPVVGVVQIAIHAP